jgi:hypothetical protein
MVLLYYGKNSPGSKAVNTIAWNHAKALGFVLIVDALEDFICFHMAPAQPPPGARHFGRVAIPV